MNRNLRQGANGRGKKIQTPREIPLEGELGGENGQCENCPTPWCVYLLAC